MRWIQVPLGPRHSNSHAKIDADTIVMIDRSVDVVTGKSDRASVLWLIGGMSIEVDIPYDQATELLFSTEAEWIGRGKA